MSSWRLFPSPKSSGAQQYSSSDVFQPVIAVPFQRRNSQWQQVPGAETAKAAINLALANGGGISIWTAGAGNVIMLIALGVNSSVTGRLTIFYNAIAIAQVYCIANQYTPFPLTAPMFLYPAASLLSVTNNTGAVSDVSANAWGAEVLA